MLVWALAEYWKNPFRPLVVIPAKAGIQSFQGILDSRFRGSDGGCRFFSNLLEKIFS
jgi:hypothetical protein